MLAVRTYHRIRPRLGNTLSIVNRTLQTQSSPRPSLLLPPRSSFDVLSSAARSCLTLFWNISKREECLDYLNDDIIKAPVLGIPMTLALYYELSSPLLKKNGFDPREFMTGAHVALERFNESQLLFMRDAQEEVDQTVVSDSDDAGENDGDATQRSLRAMLASAVENDGPTVDMTVSHDEWIKDAQEHPESPRGQLWKMLTPDMFDRTNLMSYVAKTDAEVFGLHYLPGSTKITNVALLSARAVEVPPQPVPEDQIDALTDDEKQKNDDMLNNIYDKNDLPVAAQVEVLYDMTKTVAVDKEKAPMLPPEATEVNDKGETIMTGSSLFVAVFQGWLKGGPDGKGLRWRIADNRHPWEFNV